MSVRSHRGFSGIQNWGLHFWWQWFFCQPPLLLLLFLPLHRESKVKWCKQRVCQGTSSVIKKSHHSCADYACDKKICAFSFGLMTKSLKCDSLSEHDYFGYICLIYLPGLKWKISWDTFFSRQAANSDEERITIRSDSSLKVRGAQRTCG